MGPAGSTLADGRCTLAPHDWSPLVLSRGAGETLAHRSARAAKERPTQLAAQRRSVKKIAIFRRFRALTFSEVQSAE